MTRNKKIVMTLEYLPKGEIESSDNREKHVFEDDTVTTVYQIIELIEAKRKARTLPNIGSWEHNILVTIISGRYDGTKCLIHRQ